MRVVCAACSVGRHCGSGSSDGREEKKPENTHEHTPCERNEHDVTNSLTRKLQAQVNDRWRDGLTANEEAAR